MNRYRSTIKLTNRDTKLLLFDQDFDEQQVDENNLQPNTKYKTITSTKRQVQQPSVENNSSLGFKSIVSDDMKLVDDDDDDAKMESVKVNNFFGSKKILERKLQQALQQQYNPQTRQRRQLANFEDTNEKLQKLVRQQISQREQWQRQSQIDTQKVQQHHNLVSITTQTTTSPLLIISSDMQSFQRMTSKQKLTKINEQKYTAMNIEKNTLFGVNNDNDDGEYMSPVVTTQGEDGKEELLVEESEGEKRKSRPQLRQLKKKLSTYEVLNQLDLIKKVEAPMVQKVVEKRVNEELVEFSSTQFTTPTRPQTKPTPRKTLNLSKTRIIGLDIKNFLQFSTSALPKGKYIEGTLYRDKTGVDNTFFPEYSLSLDEVTIITAKKTMKGYDIFGRDDSNNERKQLGSVKGNLMGSCYNVYVGDKQAEIIATICYDSSMTTKSVAREVEMYVRSFTHDVYMDYGTTSSPTTDLKTLSTIGNNRQKIKKYINMQPVLDTDTNMYTLDFGGKVTMASVKNVILVDEGNCKDKKVVFGKCGWDSFYLRVESGLSLLVVMGYRMTSFNFKWVTQ